jgi:MoaA/NifB/PqqE/SkfB family radical SAM enzyme
MVDVENINMLILSGGEPSTHPDFIKIMLLINSYSIEVDLLTNGDRFSDVNLVNDLSKAFNMKRLFITTTFHSFEEKKHEMANKSVGSFIRSINGLKNLHEAGASLTIKHCVTGINYKTLDRFIEFVYNNFPDDITIQISGIDYAQINKDADEVVYFKDMSHYLERMLDIYIEREEKSKSKRKITCTSIPLCTVDPYYWGYFSSICDYSSYTAIDEKGKIIHNDNIPYLEGTFSKHCEKCKVRSICPGTYLTAFELLGDDIVKPIIEI